MHYVDALKANNIRIDHMSQISWSFALLTCRKWEEKLSDRNEKHSYDKQESYLKNLNWLCKRQFLMSIRNSYIQKVYDDNEHQEYNDIEYDNINFPWKFL